MPFVYFENKINASITFGKIPGLGVFYDNCLKRNRKPKDRLFSYFFLMVMFSGTPFRFVEKTAV